MALLSPKGLDADSKMALCVSGIEAILAGHTYDGVPVPAVVKISGGQTIVTSAGRVQAVMASFWHNSSAWRATLAWAFSNIV